MEQPREDDLPRGSHPPRPRPSPADILRGLVAHTDERYQALSIEIEKIESAVRRLADVTKEAFRRAAGSVPDTAILEEQVGRLERTLADLSGRIEAMTASVEQETVQAYLTEFTERTRAGLAEVADRVRGGFATLVDRAAESNAEVLTRLGAIEERGGSGSSPPGDRVVREGIDELRSLAEEQTSRMERAIQAAAEQQQAYLQEGLAIRIERALRKAEQRFLTFEEVVEARIERGFRKAEERLIAVEDLLEGSPPEDRRSRPVSSVPRDPSVDDPFARLPVRFGDPDPSPRQAEGR